MNKLFFWVCAVLMTACASYKNDEVLTESGLSNSRFQTEINGEKTDLFVLKNKNKMEVCITNYGGRIVSVMVPDKDGIMRDVVLGFDSIQDYIKYPSDFGASIGRYANRINQGRFSLDEIVYQLPRNNYGHCLHGGPQGFQYRIYRGIQVSDREVKLTYLSIPSSDVSLISISFFWLVIIPSSFLIGSSSSLQEVKFTHITTANKAIPINLNVFISIFYLCFSVPLKSSYIK